MKEFFFGLISATRGQGPSCTRLVYLINGVAAVFCSMIATIGGTIIYRANGNANAVYWTGVTALWTATLGFGAMTKSGQQKVTKEMALAPNRGMVMSVASGR